MPNEKVLAPPVQSHGRSPENTPIPGGGRWTWDQIGGRWVALANKPAYKEPK